MESETRKYLPVVNAQDKKGLLLIAGGAEAIQKLHYWTASIPGTERASAGGVSLGDRLTFIDAGLERSRQHISRLAVYAYAFVAISAATDSRAPMPLKTGFANTILDMQVDHAKAEGIRINLRLDPAEQEADSLSVNNDIDWNCASALSANNLPIDTLLDISDEAFIKDPTVQPLCRSAVSYLMRDPEAFQRYLRNIATDGHSKQALEDAYHMSTEALQRSWLKQLR
jgi:hypothetical protein